MGSSGARGQDPSAPPAPLSAVALRQQTHTEGTLGSSRGRAGRGAAGSPASSTRAPRPPPRAAAAWAGGAFIFVLRDIYFPRIGCAGGGPGGSLHPTAPGTKGLWDRAGQTDPGHRHGTPEPWAAWCTGEPVGGQGSVTPSHSLSLSPFCRCPGPPAVPVPLSCIGTRGPLQPGGSTLTPGGRGALLGPQEALGTSGSGGSCQRPAASVTPRRPSAPLPKMGLGRGLLPPNLGPRRSSWGTGPVPRGEARDAGTRCPPCRDSGTHWQGAGTGTSCARVSEEVPNALPSMPSRGIR